MVLVMQTGAPFWYSLVFKGIDDVDVEAITAAFGTVEVVARGRAARAACPGCGRFSDRVHDRYQRRLKDLPCSGPRATRRRPGAIPADAGSRASPSSSTGAAYR
ncbi:transposase family protein [Streptomyces sp. NPDC057580]|uniref:transposase family protein n=1 Tax=Streptomyces sp. NPDC057580 TaxID=3346173 RepID=UPI00369D0D9B